jgi:hypothetical protein
VFGYTFIFQPFRTLRVLLPLHIVSVLMLIQEFDGPVPKVLVFEGIIGLLNSGRVDQIETL